jgi:hypothetical protein
MTLFPTSKENSVLKMTPFLINKEDSDLKKWHHVLLTIWEDTYNQWTVSSTLHFLSKYAREI